MQERSLPSTGDNDPLLPEFTPEKGPALDPEKGDKPEGKDENKDGDDAKPQADESGAKEKESKDDGRENSADDKSSCAPATASGDDDEPQKSGAKPSADDGDDEKPEQPKKTATKPSTRADGDESPEADESTDGKEADGDEKPAGKLPNITPKKPEPPKIKFKPLNDDLRDQIRDTIVNERRQKLLKELTAKIDKALRDVGLSLATSSEIKLTDPSPEQLERIQRRSEDELRKIASTFDVKFN